MASPTFATLIEEHYATLRQLAQRAIRSRSMPDRMSPTSLVAESVIRLMRQREKPQSEEHLRGLATVFMARVLADSHKARLRAKRGGGAAPRSIDDPPIAAGLDEQAGEPGAAGMARPMLARDAVLDAMESLAEQHPRHAEILTLHLVGGIALARVAQLVGVSERTAFRDLQAGRLWLAERLGSPEGRKT